MKSFKKYPIIYLLIAIFLLLSTACSNQTMKKQKADQAIKLIPDSHKPYVGFLLDTLQEARWYKDKALFEADVHKLGGEVKTLAANRLDDVQLKQAKLLIEEGVNVLVVVPHDAQASAAIVKIAHKAGVKVISYDRLIKNSKLDYYVSFDNEKVGELQAQEILKKVSKGNFAYIGGAPSDNNAVLFRKGAMKVLEPLINKGDIKLVFDQYSDNWDPGVAQKNMAIALNKNGNKINAVIAANDGTAGGVVQSLAAVGLAGKVPVSGQDADLEGIKRIVAGTQTMTVYKPITVLAAQAAEMAVEVAKGKTYPTTKTINNGMVDVPSVFLDPIAVTKDNILQTVVKDSFLKESDIYKK